MNRTSEVIPKNSLKILTKINGVFLRILKKMKTISRLTRITPKREHATQRKRKSWSILAKILSIEE